MRFEVLDTDILVIGGGLAGATAALKAKESGAEKVIVVSKGKLGKDSVSTFAAGVFQPAFPEDDREALLKTYTLGTAWGSGLYDEEWLKIYLSESFARVPEMEKWGVKWKKTASGDYERLTGRWNLPMAMFHGPQMMEAIAKTVAHTDLKVIGHTMVTDLLTERGKSGNRVIGAVGFNVRTGKFLIFRAKATILAAGGCAFKGRYIGHSFQTGDACAITYRAGAELGRFEIGDILHTTASTMDMQGLNMYTGLGGKFVNARGERFMEEYDPELRDSASMASVAEASALEVRAGRGPIYLDMTHFDAESVGKLKFVLPFSSKIMQQAGVMVGDQIVKKMEWAPTFFGTIAAGGGVLANTRCETSLPGLYACGDAMARAKHFPKALAGAAVTGSRAGIFAAEYAMQSKEAELNEDHIQGLRDLMFAPAKRKKGMEPDQVIIGLQEALLPYEVTIISRADRLEKAIKEVERIRAEEIPLLYATDAHYLRLAHEIANMVLVAEMYLRSRLTREESRDGCAREDFPYTDNIKWLKWTELKQNNGKMEIRTRDIDINPKYRPKKEKCLYPVFEVARKRGITWG